MKITFGNLGIIREKNIETAGRQAPAKALPENNKKVDVITISGGDIRSDAQFIEALKNQILNDVKAGMDAHKLSDLKNQVSLGQYDINAADIARRISLIE